ncbi:cilia- and flagella-associated protein 77-like [Acipenser oxyrinchus oxyrinchus]|uniref:Cilia- and flagella-associated protein 77-like n=1 Tax=Acipenser oxyrinchus oxyrinchus TaxID=40147 RepID=A0AAD8FTS0_ACIOX|nr:cilia- and flagella-associated protein 77-like [Acipenser oxyrinchus oxyrinchus]KAK1155879.1 cilia- and flagella-associated protein 77-like [Acipenser oxyrinchus oxyrinchus]
MEPVQVGVIRDSMLANPLLIRADLGRSRSRAFTLPGKEFVFGKPNVTMDGGVPEVMNHWSTLVPVTHSDSKPRKAGQDFMALNREAVKSGLVTAHEHYQFRATHDLKLRPLKEEARLDRSPPDITFGVHTRPSTPIFDLLEHRYQQRWLEECRSAQKASQAKQQKKTKLGKIYETRTSLLRQSQPSMEPRPLWQLPRFQKVGPHLETFRSAEARKRAFSSHFSDSVARCGLQGQGMYTTS